MDLWLGHITKRLQNVSKGKGTFQESCSEDLSNVKLDSPRSLVSRLGRAKKPKEEKFGDCLNGENLGLYECGMEADSFNEENLGNNDEILSESFGNRTFLRRNRRYKSLTKPLSMEIGVLSRLHREKMSMEEYMRSPFPSPCSSFSRPLFVTDGTQVISKNTGDSSVQRVLNCGIPQVKKLESSVLYVKRRTGIEKDANRRSVNRIGSIDAALLLCVGISIGIMSSFVANQVKVHKVAANAKQTVNDLEDELKTKDSSTVKDDLHNGEKQCDEKTAEKSESISKIEAELEAELERLEINMNSSKIETRLSEVFELEPEFEIEFAQGELRDDQVRRVDVTESNQEPNGNATPESGNYTVSPRELSLRLHKVINSRYQERIKELENALQESQRKMKQLVMESEEKKKPLLKIWESHESMKHKRDIKKKNNNNNPAEIQPLVMNLSGEALDAFNESYEELMDINDYSEEDDTPLEMQGNEQQEELSLTSKSSPWSHKDYIKDSSRTSEDMSFFKLQDLLDPSDDDDDEEEEFESEMEKQLIKQIVEKTKQGSSAVINAQKILFLMEDIEQNL